MKGRCLKHYLLPCLLIVGLFHSTVLGGQREVGPIVITVANLDRQLAFYTNTLPFRWISEERSKGPGFDQLTGLKDADARVATLKLGEERIQLMQFLNPRGRPIPADSRSFDHWFQHIAIVVSDMDRAYARLLAAKVKHASTAPQTLPAWNPDAGGIQAFYFRDPEDHVLEILRFPPGKGDPKWQAAAHLASAADSSAVFLGIDHTAIVVADTERTLAFYRGVLGFHIAGTAENWGTEQEHLNQVFGARLRITALRTERGPGIELLEYITPPGGRALGMDSAVNDLLAWRIRLNGWNDAPKYPDARRVGKTSGVELVRDPDGHLLEIHP